MNYSKMRFAQRHMLTGLASILLGIAMIFWPSLTFGTVKLILAVCLACHAIFSASRLLHARNRYLLLISSFAVAIDVLLGILVWLYPADDLWTLAVWIPAWAVLAGLLEITGADRTGIGRGFPIRACAGAIVSLFGVSLAIWPPLVFSLAGAASILFGGGLVVCNAIHGVKRQSGRRWNEHHRIDDGSAVLLTTAVRTVRSSQ